MTDLQAKPATSGLGRAGIKPLGKKPALLVIDVCDAYLTEGSLQYVPGRFHAALHSTERLVAKCRASNIPVIFTTVIFQNSGANGGNWYKRMPANLSSFDEGNPLRNYPANSIVHPLAGEIEVQKQYSSAFFGTSLASTLFGLGIDNLIICGFSTSGCVRSTTVDAAQYGFDPFLVKEACGDRHENIQEPNLFDIKTKFGEVVSEEDFMKLVDSKISK